MRLVAFLALLPLTAFAQTAAPETAPDVPIGPPLEAPAAPPAAPAPPVATPAATPRAAPSPAAVPVPSEPGGWSIGAGVATGVVIITSTGSGTLVERDAPAITASLERRVGDTSWLVLGVDASYAGSKAEVKGTSYYSGSSTQETKEGFLLVSAGVRHVVTPRRALAEVSIVTVATLGAVHHEEDTSYPAAGTVKVNAWNAGAELGIAIERALTGALALRVATPLVSAQYAATTQTSPMGPEVRYSTVLLRAAVAPRLELRLAF